jgi:hypothetical protein
LDLIIYTRAHVDVLIKRPSAVAKIRKLAKRTGETLTDAVERSVDERLAKFPRRRARKKAAMWIVRSLRSFSRISTLFPGPMNNSPMRK